MADMPADAIKSADGNYWWDGSAWQPVQSQSTASPSHSAAQVGTLSEDLRYRWDGSAWQPVDQPQYSPAPTASSSASGSGQSHGSQTAGSGGHHQAVPAAGGGSSATGLLTDSSIDSYVNQTYGSTISSMSADDRARTLMDTVNGLLRQGGAPDVHYQFGISGDGNYGAFDADQWTMSLNEHYFGATGMDTDQLQRDYREALLTVYHEARHAEQAFLMARERAGLGATADQIIQAMSQNPNSAPVPARWVVELAVQNPITQCDHTQYLTEQWYQSMYGSGADHRAGVLGHPESPDFDRQYHRLPEEADAWNADDRTRERYNQQGH